ncbi:MAG TPA: roadblock/LC7 domain-containing protein [Thermoanaerobaculia bacterium]|nr:roadblock/LC7 domain-containing protein [Thermoanaerobaculia bacterium]
MSFADALEGLLGAPGALGAAFIDAQGAIVARVGERSATEVLGAYQSVWLGELRRAAERSGLGEISDLSCQFQNRLVLTIHVKAGYFILVVFDPGGQPHAVRPRLDEARTRLAAEIS